MALKRWAPLISKLQELPYKTKLFPEQREKRTVHSNNLHALKTVDLVFTQILDFSTQSNPLESKDLSELLSSAIKVQCSCVLAVIHDELDKLEGNQTSFSEEFLHRNVDNLNSWKDIFGSAKSTDSPVALGQFVSLVESFHSFLTFFHSYQEVICSWPLPMGFYYPKVSDQLDIFLDHIPSPPKIAYSLIYCPQLTREELKFVICNEYNKASSYLSAHLDDVQQRLLQVVQMHGKSTLPEVIGKSNQSCYEGRDYIERKLKKAAGKLSRPIVEKLVEFSRRVKYVETYECGLDLQAERLYASEQVLASENHVRNLNDCLQRKLAKYLTVANKHLRQRFCNAKAIVSSSTRHVSDHRLTFKEDCSAVINFWNEKVDEMIELNSKNILDVITNTYEMQEQLSAVLVALNTDII